MEFYYNTRGPLSFIYAAHILNITNKNYIKIKTNTMRAIEGGDHIAIATNKQVHTTEVPIAIRKRMRLAIIKAGS